MVSVRAQQGAGQCRPGWRRRLPSAGLAATLTLLTAASMITLGAGDARALAQTTVLDDFTSVQSAGVAAPGSSTSLRTGTTGVLGGARRLDVTATGGAATATVASSGAVPTLSVTEDPTATATVTATYDGGSPAPGDAAPTGLGTVDLTDAGTHTALFAPAGASAAGVTATVTVYTDATHCSAVSQPLPVVAAGLTAGDGSTAAAWRFTDLKPLAGCAAAADPAKVGAVIVTLDTSAAPGATAWLGGLRSAALDYGDLPTSLGVTDVTAGGAAAGVDPTLHLGQLIGGSADAQPSATASADGNDDGIALTRNNTWSAGDPSTGGGGSLDVTVAGSGCLSLWLTGVPAPDFAAPAARIVTNRPVTTGNATLRFALPPDFALPASVFVRGRLFPRDADASCSTPEPIGGVSRSGEIEDYVFTLTGPPDPVQVVTSPASPSASAAPSWTFTHPAGTVESCAVTAANGTNVQAAQECDRGFTASLAGQPDGTYTLAVTAVDALGRSGAPATSAYVLDSTAPAPPVLTVSPASPSGADTVSWSFTLPTGTTGRCSVSGPSGLLQDGVVCTSPASVSLAGTADGTYTFAVTAVDAAGNLSAVTTSSVVRDTLPPRPPVVTAGQGISSVSQNGQTYALTASRSPQWTFLLPDPSQAQCRLTGPGAVVLADWATCSTPYTANLAKAADGTYSLAVRAVDGAGNASATVTRLVVLDTTAPAPLITSSPANPGNSSMLQWSFATGDPSATARCQLTRGDTGAVVVVAAYAPCGSTVSYDQTGAPDGTYTLSVIATDLAGNASAPVTSQAVLDRVPPAAPVISAPPSSPRHDPNVEWTVTGDGTAVVSCTLTGPSTVLGPAPCTGPTSFQLAADPDGTYTLSARSIDQAGNASIAVTSAIVLDRSAPGLALTGSPTSPATSRSPAWSFRTDPGSLPECRLDILNGRNIQPYQACSSPYVASLQNEPDATYVFSVRASDSAGNVAGPQQSRYVLDTTAPAPPTILRSPTSPSSSRAPTWGFSSETGASAECRVLLGSATAGTVLTDWTACAGSWTSALLGVPDTLVTFQVRATDAAGNVGAAATGIYTLDTVAEPPHVTLGPANPGRVASLTWQFGVAPDETARCSLDRDGTTVVAASACSGSVTYNVSGDGDGTYTLTVVATDTAGNVSTATTASAVLDQTPPAAPTFSTSPPTPGTTRAPTWTFAGPADGTTSCRVVDNGVGLTSWTSCAGSVTADLTGLADGTYTVQVRATDAAGNVSPSTTGTPYNLLTAPPAAPVITHTPGAGGALQSGVWSFTLPPGSTGECRLTDGGVVLADWAPCATAATYDLSAAPDGTVLFNARAVDAVQATGAAATAAFVLDRTPPALPVVVSGQGHEGAGGVVHWSFTSDPGAAATCQLTKTDGTVVSAWAPCTGSYAYDVSSRGPGGYVFAVRTADAWGNTTTAVTDSYAYNPPYLPPGSNTQIAPNAGLTPGAGDRNRIRDALPAVTEVEKARGPEQHTRVNSPVQLNRNKSPPVEDSAPSPKLAVAAPPQDSPIVKIGQAFGKVLTETRDHAALPLALIIVALLFLAVQDRLDRGDPKLALAPSNPRSDYLEFR